MLICSCKGNHFFEKSNIFIYGNRIKLFFFCGQELSRAALFVIFLNGVYFTELLRSSLATGRICRH
jgi:hypothetical protein